MAVKQQKSYPLRLEEDLVQWVKKRAKDGDRSINAELIRIVRKAKEEAAEPKAA